MRASSKETASFIAAMHDAVRQFDEFHLSTLDSVSFLPELIRNALGDDSATRRKHIQSIWGRDRSEKEKRVLSFFKNIWLSETKGAVSAEFSSHVISEIANYSFSEVVLYLDLNRV